MSPPSGAPQTGGRLTGEDMRHYMQDFSDKFLKDKIRFHTEVLMIRRDDITSKYFIEVEDKLTGQKETLEYSRVVVCSGVSQRPNT